MRDLCLCFIHERLDRRTIDAVRARPPPCPTCTLTIPNERPPRSERTLCPRSGRTQEHKTEALESGSPNASWCRLDPRPVKGADDFREVGGWLVGREGGRRDGDSCLFLWDSAQTGVVLPDGCLPDICPCERALVLLVMGAAGFSDFYMSPYAHSHSLTH